MKIGVVLVVIGALGVIVLPLFQGNVGHHTVERMRHGDLVTLSSSIERYKDDLRRYPSSLDDLLNGYVRYIPKDSWGSGYVYKPSGDAYDLYSIGKNIIDDGGLQDDIALSRSSGYLCEFYEIGCWVSLVVFLSLLSLGCALLGIAIVSVQLVRISLRRWKT